MIAGVLCHKLLYDGANYLDAFQKSKYLLKKVSDDCFIKSVRDDSSDHWMLLYVICEYYDKHGVLPPKPIAVRDFAAVSEDLQISARKDMIVGTIKEIRSLDEAALRVVIPHEPGIRNRRVGRRPCSWRETGGRGSCYARIYSVCCDITLTISAHTNLSIRRSTDRIKPNALFRTWS
jgi:hypothetical protein